MVSYMVLHIMGCMYMMLAVGLIWLILHNMLGILMFIMANCMLHRMMESMSMMVFGAW